MKSKFILFLPGYLKAQYTAYSIELHGNVVYQVSLSLFMNLYIYLWISLSSGRSVYIPTYPATRPKCEMAKSHNSKSSHLYLGVL